MSQDHFATLLESMNVYKEAWKAKMWSSSKKQKTGFLHPCTSCAIPLGDMPNSKTLHIRAGSSHGCLYGKFTFNPGKLLSEEWAKFYEFFVTNFEYGYASVYHLGRLQYIEIAADFYGAHYDECFYVDTKLRTINDLFVSKGTVYLGAKNAPRQLVVYDKAKELKEAQGIDSMVPQLRIEARLLKNVKTTDLNELPNPFGTLIVVPKAQMLGLKIADKFWNAFQSKVKAGFEPQEAYLLFPSKNRKWISAVLKEIQCKWWDAEKVWEEGKIAAKILKPTDLCF